MGNAPPRRLHAHFAEDERAQEEREESPLAASPTPRSPAAGQDQPALQESLRDGQGLHMNGKAPLPAPPKTPMSSTSPGRDESMSPGMYPLSDLVQIAHGKSPEESSPKTKTDMFAVSTACIATCLIVVVFYVTLTSIQKKRAKSRYLCETEDCVRHAALLTGKIDWKLDPCDDFEAFVCSGWNKKSFERRPVVQSGMDDLRFAWYDRLESVLTQGALQLPAGRKPLSMYRMCRRYYPSNASQIALFRSFIESNGLRWPEPPDELRDPLQLVVALSYLWESPLWITVGLTMQRPDSSTGRHHRRVVIAPGAYLPIMRYHHAVVERSYIRYWEQFLELFYPDAAARPLVNETVIQELRAIEKDVLNSFQAVSASSRKRPVLLPFRDVGLYAPNASSQHWLQAFQGAMSLDPKLVGDDEIAVSDIALLRTVFTLVTKYTTLQLNRYFTWLIVQYCSPVADFALLVGYYGSKVSAEEQLPMFCGLMAEAAYKVLVLALSASSLFTPRDREVIDAGFDHIVSAAVRKVNDTDWIDAYSKPRTIDKLEATRKHMWPHESLLRGNALDVLYVGFPEDGPQSLTQYWIEVREALKRINKTSEYMEALFLPSNSLPDYLGYDYISNVVKLALGAAAAPAYYRNGTQAMLYSGLLFLIAIQLVRAIDEEGIKWASQAFQEENSLLSNSTLEVFRTKAKCGQVDGEETVFPEVPALEIAYAALSESHLRGAETVPLSLAPNLPEDKVFFMTLCYLSCARPGDRNLVPADCNKVARNSHVFAKAFNCSEGSRMNPVKKCSFFG
ncbi:endothelin-converting enzyme 2 [Rhipicephalus microplus]|uniref:endothelin-converting enzyme 2 n=1 Tax=Rhipicephalus microplus TaxID=6941 RepID=UPI003F6BFFB4